MSKQMVTLMIGAACAVTALMLSCSQQPNETAPEQKPEKVHGYLYNYDGTAASGALVTLVKSDYIPSGQGIPKKTATAATTSTDKNGRFAYDNLSAGTYNVFGSTPTGDNASYTPSVSISDTDSGICIIKDTLKPTGALKGNIQFSPYADSRSALILMLGGTRMTWPEDGQGNFKITKLAQGTYSIRFLPTNPAYSILDTSFRIFSAETSDVGTINLTGKQFDTLGSDTIVVRGHSISGIWGPNKTFKVMCDVVIPQGERLEIKEGAHIVLMGNYNFGTDGNCIARGTIDNPVVFTYGLNYAGNGWNWFGTYTVDGYNIGINPDSLVFNNCIFEYCKQPCFEIKSLPLPPFYFEMKNCIFRHLQDGIRIVFGHTGSLINNVGERIIITNCIFHDVQTTHLLSGIEVVHPLIDVQNSIGPWNCKQNTFLKVTNNIFFQERWSADFNCYFPYNCYDTTYFTPADPTCVFTDPQFVNIKNGDYHLMSNSPCRGTGLHGEDMGLKFEK